MATQAAANAMILNEIGIEAGKPSAWAMIARVGAWLHPAVGTELVTSEDLASALAIFNRRQELTGNQADVVIDYHHASIEAPRGGTRAPAAGWIKEMELRAGGTELWGRVLWVTEAANAIVAQEYKHLSPVLVWGQRDSLTGEKVRMTIHSVALTNTPVMADLKALNQAPANDAGATDTSITGGQAMSLLELIAKVLGIEPGQVASKLGVTETGDAAVAQAILGMPTLIQELQAKLDEAADKPPAEPPAVPEEIANALGVPAGADSTALRAAIIKLKMPGAGLTGVRRKLGLDADADEAKICNAIGALQETRRNAEAEDLVDEFVKLGKVPPSDRDWFVERAKEDIEATRTVLNSLGPVLNAPDLSKKRTGPEPSFSDTDAHVCKLLSIDREAFEAARN